MCEGSGDELWGIPLGDERLNQRSYQILEAVAANPEASIKAACDGWSDAIAADRVFNKASVTPEQILQPHREATPRRLREHPVVWIVPDTTELDFTKHPPTDARCLNKPERFGLYAPVQLAVTPDKLCRGVMGADFFDREPETLGKADERSSLPLEQQESFRGLEGYRPACGLAAECPQTQIVSVADREADLYDIFVEAQQPSGPRADGIIRARVDRGTPERDLASGPAADCKGREEVSPSPLRATRTIALSPTPKRAARHLDRLPTNERLRNRRARLRTTNLRWLCINNRRCPPQSVVDGGHSPPD